MNDDYGNLFELIFGATFNLISVYVCRWAATYNFTRIQYRFGSDIFCLRIYESPCHTTRTRTYDYMNCWWCILATIVCIGSIMAYATKDAIASGWWLVLLLPNNIQPASGRALSISNQNQDGTYKRIGKSSRLHTVPKVSIYFYQLSDLTFSMVFWCWVEIPDTT